MKISGCFLLMFGVCCLYLLEPSFSNADEKVPVFVSILPQKYFVKKIAGDLADVSVMVQPGDSPATYEPKPKQMAMLASTRIYFAIGVPFEAVWLAKISSANPGMRIIHIDEGIEKIPMETLHHHGDEEGQKEIQEDHYGGPKDPHVWTSPKLVKIIAGNICRAFVKMDGANGKLYEENLRRFIIEIDQLDNVFKELFAEDGSRKSFMVFHPSWGYFARSYGLEQIPVEMEGKNPKPAQLQQLISEAREKGINVIFVQPQFSTQSAKVVAEAIGGSVVFADPLAYDWAENLKQQARAFKAAIR